MVEYVYDSKGKKTGVIIPLELWEKNKSKFKKIEDLNEDTTSFHPSDFRGIYSNMKFNLEEEARKMREEWVRI